MKETLRYWKDYVWSRGAAARHVGRFCDVSAYCMFIGYPRSGHTLYGALLNAHPDAVVSHELDALSYIERGIRRDQLYALILRREQWFREERHNTQFNFDYTVPNQWQGRYRNLKVIGDKKGGSSSSRLTESPELLDALRRTVQVPLRIVHIVRNPFDNISTLCRRNNYGIEQGTQRYFLRADTNGRLIETCDPSEVLTMRHEEFIARPKDCLRELVQFVGLEPDESYLSDCAGIVFNKPSRSRSQMTWEKQHLELVRAGIDDHPFLHGYTFDV